MPTSFGSYDTNQDGSISADEWAQFYPDGGGPASEQPAQQPQQPFNLEEFMARVTSGNFTDEDLMAFSNWMIGQQLGQQAGQLDYQNNFLDYQNSVVDLNEQQLGQQYAEFEFMKNQYFPWYTGDYFDYQQQQAQNQMAMSNNQVAISGIEQDKAADYALAQKFNTEAAQYGAQAARDQYLTTLAGQKRSVYTPFSNMGY